MCLCFGLIKTKNKVFRKTKKKQLDFCNYTTFQINYICTIYMYGLKNFNYCLLLLIVIFIVICICAKGLCNLASGSTKFKHVDQNY